MATTIKRDTVERATSAISEQDSVDQAERAALMRAQHRRRLLAAIGEGYALTGVRLSRPDRAEGVVINFDQAEGAALVGQIKALIEARK